MVKLTQKTGMLGSVETIDVLSDMIEKHNLSTVVVDPVSITLFPVPIETRFESANACHDQVMVSTSGAQLLPHEAIKHLARRLLERTTLLTPNIPEAALLLTENGHAAPEVRNVADLETLAQTIRAQLGPRWVLVKGGHVPFRAADMTAVVPEGGSDADKEGETVVVDVLVGPDGEVVKVQSAFQRSTSTHGTGCSLACKFGESRQCLVC